MIPYVFVDVFDLVFTVIYCIYMYRCSVEEERKYREKTFLFFLSKKIIDLG